MEGSWSWKDVDFDFPYMGRAAGVAEALWCRTTLEGAADDEWVQDHLHRMPGQFSDPYHPPEDWPPT